MSDSLRTNTVVVRADASARIGSGHIMRCLTLANALREKGAAVTFLARTIPQEMREQIEASGHVCVVLPPIVNSDEKEGVRGEGVRADAPVHAHWLDASEAQDAAATCEWIERELGCVDWLVVDHYALDKVWESQLRRVARRIMVVDDLADRPHDCDLLLDQNQDDAARYRSLVPENTKLLCGPHYAMLRPAFAELRAAQVACPSRQETPAGEPVRLLLFFGGGDFSHLTNRALDALEILPRLDASLAEKIAHVDVVVGSANPELARIRERCDERADWHLHVDTPRMAELIAKASLILGAPGSSAWERCCLGAPSVLIALADNQEPIAAVLERHGAACYLGRHEDVDAQAFAEACQRLLTQPETLRQMAQRAWSLVDGQGTARVLQTLGA